MRIVKTRFTKKFIFLALCLTFLIILMGAAYATVRYGRIPGHAGLSFRNIGYGHENLSVEIVNNSKNNVMFGGAMLFLDRHSKELARAEILPEKIKRGGSKNFRGVFTKGSGEDAAMASRLVWELR